MKKLAIIGTSALGSTPFVERLIEALRLEGLSVSCVKRAPDGFDMDKPGKASFARRQAGAAEVMLVGDRRLVLMKEHRGGALPTFDDLLARLEPVDVVLAEGFHGMAVPTIEVHKTSNGRHPRYPGDRNVIAVVCDQPLEAVVPSFRTDEVERLGAFVIAVLELQGETATPA